jgi:NADPH:quinone reductase-like Zn-dependent oxidoreductase
MTAVAARSETMRAILNERYGPPSGLRLGEVARPEVGDDRILVRVHSASVNPIDWHLMRGSPYIVRYYMGLRRPGSAFLGSDVAGMVEAVGRDVQDFQAGDEVLGSCHGTFAEYALGRERNLGPKPSNLSFEQAAALPGAGVTALEAVRDYSRVEDGQRVLVNGAAGGVGTFTVQIAKSFGAHVTGVCSARNSELVRSLGADEVIDYTSDDFTRRRRHYDVILDNVGNRSLMQIKRALKPDGTLVAVAGGPGGRLLGGQRRKRRIRRLNQLVRETLTTFQADVSSQNILALTELVASGKVTPVIDRTYPLEEAAEAISYIETQHARGKVVLSVAP